MLFIDTDDMKREHKDEQVHSRSSINDNRGSVPFVVGLG
jgi:hypothetical protein